MLKNKEKLSLNIKKVQGNLKKIMEMIEKDNHCASIAHQVNACMGLLQSLNRELLRNHLHCCGAEAFTGKSGKTKDEFIEELIQTWDVTTRK